MVAWKEVERLVLKALYLLILLPIVIGCCCFFPFFFPFFFSLFIFIFYFYDLNLYVVWIVIEKSLEEDKGQNLAFETEGDRCKPSSGTSKTWSFYI